MYSGIGVGVGVGIGSGVRVLDVALRNGRRGFPLRGMVGKTGEVKAIDHDSVARATARNRADTHQQRAPGAKDGPLVIGRS